MAKARIEVKRPIEHYINDSGKPADIRFDYDNQAWIVNGEYQRCGHPESMDCRCYGREHAGEKAPNIY